MNIWNKLIRRFSKKGFGVVGGIDLLSRLTGNEYDKSKLMEQYTKSLYVFACISRRAEKVASIKLRMYRILNSKGESKEITAHPALDLLYKANEFQTKAEFLEQTIINLDTAGDAYWYKVRNKGGKVVELWNLRPDFVTIMTDKTAFVKGYKFSKMDGTEELFPAEDIVHIKNVDPLSQYYGTSPLKAAQRRVQTEDFATSYQRDFFLNSARPDAILKYSGMGPNKEQKDEIRQSWAKRHQGVGNSSKLAILEGGMDYQQISISQKEMDYIESMKFTRDDILVAFKVPKPILTIVEDVNRANSETAMAIFLSETIKPLMSKLVEKMNEELITPDFGDEFYIDFDDPTPDDVDLKIKKIQSGVFLFNEGRQLFDLPPVKGGNTYYQPISNIPVGGLPSESKEFVMGAREERRKMFDFRGHYWLQKKFEMRESVEGLVEKAMARKLRKKKIKKTYKPLIADKEVRKAYGQMMVKKMDAQSNQLKAAANDFAKEQMDRVVKKLESKVKSAKKKLSATQIFNMAKEKEVAISFVIPFIESFLKESGQEALGMIAPQEEWQDTEKIQKAIQKRAEQFAEEVNSTTLTKLDATLAEGINESEGITELRERVEDVYSEFPTYRSEMIARTEATNANNLGLLEGYRQSDVATGKEWIATMDDRTRDEHMALDGEIVGLNEKFSNGLAYPSEPNCRCVLGPAFIE